ncbi:hypothetical protein EDB19DRAFT_1830343 [Suillus lakei]|nr:hypothetical protein EDB19DRAFT_1830343 [Suillus lakei]
MTPQAAREATLLQRSLAFVIFGSKLHRHHDTQCQSVSVTNVTFGCLTCLNAIQGPFYSKRRIVFTPRFLAPVPNGRDIMSAECSDKPNWYNLDSCTTPVTDTKFDIVKGPRFLFTLTEFYSVIAYTASVYIWGVTTNFARVYDEAQDSRICGVVLASTMFRNCDGQY